MIRSAKARIVLFLAAAAVGASMAIADPVYSVNVVLFDKTTSKENSFDLFSNMATQSDSNTANEVFGDQMSENDQVLIYTPPVYAVLTKIGAEWVDSGGNPATNSLDSNVGFWLQNTTASRQTNVITGDVVQDVSISVPIVAGFQIISYPYSTSFQLNDSDLTNGYTGTPGIGDNDQVLTWDVDTGVYTVYTLSDDQIWIDGGGSPVVAALQPNRGFWYQHKGTGFNWVENNPYPDL